MLLKNHQKVQEFVIQRSVLNGEYRNVREKLVLHKEFVANLELAFKDEPELLLIAKDMYPPFK